MLSSFRKRLVCALAVMSLGLVFAGGLVAGCKVDDNPGNNGGGEINKPDPKPDQIGEFEVGNVRVQLLSDTLVRIEEKGAKGFEDRNTYLIQNRTQWEGTTWTESKEDGKVVISTDVYDVKVSENAKSVADAVIYSKDGEIVWKYEGKTSTNVYLPSPSDALDVWYFSDSPRIVPSDLGYTVDKTDSAYLQDWDFDNDAADFYVFLPDGSYKKFCQDYTDLTGKSDMVTLQMLGYWDSRWYAYSSETALKQIEDYREKGYSIDILVIDTDWRDASSGVGYEINTQLFPDMAKFLEECHKMGVNIVFNDHPEPVPGTNNGLDSSEVGYRTENLTMLLSLGLDYWWYDRNWHVALNSADPDISVYAFGMYCYQWITNDYLQSIKDINEYAERALIMANVDGCLHGNWKYASDISAHRYSIQWTGDIGSNSDALAQEIYAAVFGGAEVGLPYVSSDIGGHTAPVTDDMYVRWMQYGALSTICRVHCTHTNYIGQEGRMPWLFGQTAEDVTKAYIGMRYRLLPLYYNLARENYDTGLPIMRRTDIEYPQYAEASRNDQYLLGENILIAPIAESEVLDKVPESWLTHDSGASGLVANYYKNTGFTGTPFVRTDSNVYFDWGNGAPSGTGVGNDNFSVKWTGNITFDKKGCLKFYADDDITVLIDGKVVVQNKTGEYDTLYSTPYYEAGSQHTIEVRYVEYGGGAHVYMYFSEMGEDGSLLDVSRTVFIPDGAWLDVWTGTRYVGPQTITVKHGLTTSPIFVREGAVLALAQDMQSTSEKDWSKLALDVYPGLINTSTTLYEDDTTTQGYKDGKYRKTQITQSYNSATHTYTVKVGKAVGDLTGDKAFTSREWTVRIHARAEWGTLKSVNLNGRAVGTSMIIKDVSAIPFSFDGGSPDADIYTFTFTAETNKESVIEFVFTNPDSVIAPEYDRTSVNFSLSADEVGEVLNLTEAGTIDWAYFGADKFGSTARKNIENNLFGTPSAYSSQWSYDDGVMDISWTDGKGVAEGTDVNTGIVGQKDFTFTITTAGKKAYYVIYAAGFKSTAKFTVRDRAGNVKTVSFGNLDGNYNRKIVIYCDSDKVTELYVTYHMVASLHAGTGSPSNVALNAMYASETLKENQKRPVVNVTGRVTSMDGPGIAANLTNIGYADWATFKDNGQRVSKVNSDIIGNVSFANGGQGFGDYSCLISWSDGDTETSNSGTRNGTCSLGDINISLNVDENTQSVTLYTGAWNSGNTVYVYDRQGKQIAKSTTFSSTGNPAATRAIEIKIDAASATKITIKIEATNRSQNGNVSLAALGVMTKN